MLIGGPLSNIKNALLKRKLGDNIEQESNKKKYSYKILEEADLINVNPGECVIDYIMNQLKGKHGFKSLTRSSLIKYF